MAIGILVIAALAILPSARGSANGGTELESAPGATFEMSAVPPRLGDSTGGQIEWIRQFGTAMSEDAFAIAVDVTGVYVAGRTLGSLPGQTNAGYSDAFVCKFDSQGNMLWTRQFGTQTADDALAVAADGSNVYVAGGTSGTLPGQTNHGGSDAFLRAYDEKGNELWTRQFGTSLSDGASALVTHATGIYVAGSVGSGARFDAFVRRFDTLGNELWERQFGDPYRVVGAGGIGAD